MKTTTKRILSLALSVAVLFGVYTALPPNFGPALEQAAALNAATASPTDLELMPIEPEEDSVTAVTENPNVVVQNNIAVKVVVNNSNIDRCTWRVTLTTGLKFYGFRPGDISAERANGLISTSGTYIYLDIVSSDNFTQGMHLVTLYFTADVTVSNPQTAWYNTVLSCVSDSNTSIPNPFVLTYALLGDANISGEVDAQDSLWIQRYVVNSLSSSDIINMERQCLAADVNLDGVVSTLDNLDVLKRTTEKIKSFLDINRIFVPSGKADGVNGYLTYRIKNAQSNNYIKTDSQGNALLGPADTVLSTEFALVSVNSSQPIYRLVSQSNNLNLCLDSNGNLAFGETTNSNNTYRWFIIPKNDKYYLVNETRFDQPLCNYGLSYLDDGNLWEITPMIRVKAFYDLAYKTRMGSDVATELRKVQNELGFIVSNLFGVEVAIPSPGAVVSHADTCHGSNLTTGSTLSLNQANAACGHSAGSTSDCVAYYEDTSNPPNSNVHHKNSRAVLYYFKNSSYNKSYRYELLYSGHNACGKNSKTNEHEIDVVAGVAYTSTPSVGEVFYVGGNTEYRIRITALHELCHMLGASGGDVDKEHHECQCIMSAGANRDNNYLLDKWITAADSNKTQTQRLNALELLICDDCKKLITTHLQIAIEEE